MWPSYPAIPLTTQSDPGSKNYGVANIQTHARHELDPSLAGTLQHCWKRNKMNVKSEANWSVFRRDFAPGYEDLFESGVNAGYYNVDDVLEKWVSYHEKDYSHFLKKISSVWSFVGLPFHGSKVNLTSGLLFAIELFHMRTPRKYYLMEFLN
jgi:hypothetical protein